MPGDLNTGIVGLSAQIEGRDEYVIAEVYYDKTAAEPRPVWEVSGLIETGQVRNRAMRVWNSSPAKRIEVTVTNLATGVPTVFAMPGDGDLTTPVVTATAAQLANFGVTTQDHARSLTLTVFD